MFRLILWNSMMSLQAFQWLPDNTAKHMLHFGEVMAEWAMMFPYYHLAAFDAQLYNLS